jgi:hypothetical protein
MVLPKIHLAFHVLAEHYYNFRASLKGA